MPNHYLLQPASEYVDTARHALSNIANADTGLLPNNLIALAMQAVTLCNRMSSVIASQSTNEDV